MATHLGRDPLAASFPLPFILMASARSIPANEPGISGSTYQALLAATARTVEHELLTGHGRAGHTVRCRR
ncbi:MAG: hypothetical protein JO020_24010 [Chloroflexi bacterium]|nr:hypothetical protein [Chloroflexota bacterium]